MNKVFGRYLEEFKVGNVYQHCNVKTITEEDNNAFCLLTMNHHPVHLDKEYAKNQQHGKILVVGTYVLSLAVGLSVPDVSGKAIANLEYEKITHDAPVFLGDTLRAESEILTIRESKNKPDRGIVYIETRAYNQNKIKVLTLRRKILIPKRRK
ncbi:MAG: MaoC family dehydratase [Candidatus Margulisbacteria bacterium]|nr:MaoC family dehydratase [Candidatus Margulisiibacteriota bacterium]